jgi:formamidopyrimidine-DNA glycosylase
VPELPEAETIVRTLRPRVEGRAILEAQFLSARASRSDPATLAGRRVVHVRRYGKQVLWELDSGCLLVKLGMTGALLLDSQPGPYTRAVLRLEDATVLYNDVRQFGCLEIREAAPSALGPDPLEIDPADFLERLNARKTCLKALLLDQRFLRGLGNIYADEALFRAGMHPLARTGKISADRGRKLHAAIVSLLEDAILHRGSSISDYVDAAGERGSFQLRHAVYGRDGEPCPRCGGKVSRIVVAQRGTHFCPRCQKRNR